MAIAFATQATVFTSTSSTDQYESNSITVSGGSDRLLCVAIETLKDSAAHGLAFDSVDFGTASRTYGTGTAMTQQLIVGGGGWPALAFYTLVAPTGTGTVQIDAATNNLRAVILDVFELTGVDQTTPVEATNSGTIPTPPDGDIGMTTTNANSMMITFISHRADGTNPAEADAGATTLHTANTGTASFNDIAGAGAYEIITSAGAELHSYTYDGSGTNIYGAIEINAVSSGPLDNDRITSMMFQQHYMPTPMGT